MKKILLALLVSVIAGAAVVLPAAALARVTALKVSPSEDVAQANPRLGADTKVAYVHFDYEGAANEKLSVALMGLGLSSILVKTDTYNGQGSAVVELTGAEVYRSIVGQLSSYAIQSQSDVKRAADQELGRRGYLEQVQSHVAMVDRMLLVLEQMDLPDDAANSAGATRVALDDLATLADEAVAPDLDDAGRKAKAEEMKAPSEAVVRSADLLADSAETVGAMALPLTGENAPFTVQVQVRGNPSASVEFWVVENTQGAVSNLDPTKDSGGSGTGETSRPTSRPAATAAAGATASVPANRNRTSASGSSSDAGAGASTSGNAGMPTTPSQSMGSAPYQVTAAPGASSSDAASGEEQEAALDVVSSAGAESGAFGQQGADAQAMPTWTVPANALAAAGGQGAPSVKPLGATTKPAGGSGGSGGPNLLILTIGAAMFIGVAFWLRQRM